MLPYQRISDKIKAQRVAVSGFGQAFDTFGPGGAVAAPAPAPAPGAAPAAVSGTGAVLTGVASILAPLAQAGIGIYQAQQMAKIEKARLKAEQRAYAAPIMPAYFPPPPTKSRLPLILGIVGGAIAISVVLVLVVGGDDDKKPTKKEGSR